MTEKDVVSRPCESRHTKPSAACLPSFDLRKAFSDQASAPDQGQCESSELTHTMDPHASRSFAAVKDDLVSRRHQRSSTVQDANCTAARRSDSSRLCASFYDRATGVRRDGIHVPRIFTGSFSQLEIDIRRLKLDKVKTPEDQPDLPRKEHLKVRDFAVTPQRSPYPSPSPATLLFRHEACLSKETELQSRIINGEVIRTRRPSTKVRAQTADETTGGIDAWPIGGSDRGGSPTAAASQLPRPQRKHTI